MVVIINDTRYQSQFTKTSFSNFKKTELIKELLNTLQTRDLERGCYFVSEMVCSGYYIDLWNMVITHICKYIHISNPRLIIYLKHKIYRFKNIANNNTKGEIDLRNNTEVRTLFCELVILICHTNNKTALNEISVKSDELNIDVISRKFQAPNYSFVQTFFQNGDPKEIYMALNEFAFHISSSSSNYNMACYWFEWLLMFDEYCKKKKEKIAVMPRNFVIVGKGKNKGNTDLVWCIWDCLINRSEKLGQGIQKMMSALCDIYQLKYDSRNAKKRKSVIYNAIYICIEQLDFSIPLCTLNYNQEYLIQNTDKIYTTLKKQEIIEEQEDSSNGKIDKIKQMETYMYNF